VTRKFVVALLVGGVAISAVAAVMAGSSRSSLKVLAVAALVLGAATWIVLRSGAGASVLAAGPLEGIEIKRPTRRFVATLLGGALVLGAIAAYLGSGSGSSTKVLELVAVLFPFLIWKRPQLAPAVLVSLAILVEQYGYQPGEPSIPITPRLKLFYGISSLHLEPMDILLLIVIIIYLLKSAEWGGPRWPRSHISAALTSLLGLVVVGVIVGKTHHAPLRVAMMEARPFVYLWAMYFITVSLVRSRKAVSALLWALVATVVVKAFQGLYVYIHDRGMYPRPQDVIGHEAAYFFVIYFVFVLALWIFRVRGPLRTIATRLLPLVFFVHLVNNRRAGWLMMVGALAVLLVVSFRSLPNRRRLLGEALVVLLAFSAVYFPLYWNKTDSIAQPAHALKSAIKPDPRDASSDLYRTQENANLLVNIKQGGLVGKGFGVKIDYPLPIVNITSLDPGLVYVPHNGVLYILMRTGLLGGIALWMVIGAGIIAGCRLARSRDRQFAVIGVVVASALVAWALEGAIDQGFTEYRIAFVTGTLLGLAEAARMLARRAPPVAPVDDPGEVDRPALGNGVVGGLLASAHRQLIPTRKLAGALTDSLMLYRRFPLERQGVLAGVPPSALTGVAPVGPEPAHVVAPESESPASRLARNIGALAGGQLVTWVMTLAWTLIVPRLLGPANMGLIVTALAVTGVLSIILSLGTHLYLTRAVILDPENRSKLVGTAIVMRIVTAPLLIVGAAIYAHVAHFGHEATIVLYLVAIMTALSLINDPMLAAFQAIERMKYMAYSDVINKTGQSVIGIAVVAIGLGATGVTATMAIVAAVVVVLNLRWLHSYMHLEMRPTKRMVVDLFRHSLSFWAVGLFATVYLWIDTVMLSLLTRPTVVGWYGVTTTLLQTLMFLPTMLATAWLPRLVAAFKEDGHRQLTRAAQTPVEFLFVVSVPVAAATVLAAGWIIPVLYGPAYHHAVPVMMILALCIPTTYLNIMLNQVLVAAKRQVVWTWVMAGGLIVNPLINLALIRYTQHHYGNGAIGAAIALVITELGMSIVGLTIVGRHIFDRRGLKRCALAAIAAGVMWCIGYAVSPAGAPIALVAGGAAFVLLAIMLRIPTDDELALVRSGIAWVKSRRS
jgi:O-antigen/teichoic acid export membrane protein